MVVDGKPDAPVGSSLDCDRQCRRLCSSRGNCAFFISSPPRAPAPSVATPKTYFVRPACTRSGDYRTRPKSTFRAARHIDGTAGCAGRHVLEQFQEEPLRDAPVAEGVQRGRLPGVLAEVARVADEEHAAPPPWASSAFRLVRAAFLTRSRSSSPRRHATAPSSATRAPNDPGRHLDTGCVFF